MRSVAIQKIVPNILEVVSGPLQGAGKNVGKECFRVRYSDAPAEFIWEPEHNILRFPGGREQLKAYRSLKRV